VGCFLFLPVKSAKQQKLSSSKYFWKKMEIKDSSIFSDHGKAIFSRSQTSEVSMGNPDTAEEKKSQIETKKQEIKENQEVNMNCNSNIEPNLVGNGIVGEIGESGKIQIVNENSGWGNLGNSKIIKKSTSSKEETETPSLSSGLDDLAQRKLVTEKPESTTKSNKTGTEPINHLSGIPKFHPSQKSGKGVDSYLENPVNSNRKISPSTRQAMGKTATDALDLAQEGANNEKNEKRDEHL
jgi:hypothetical protein